MNADYKQALSEIKSAKSTLDRLWGEGANDKNKVFEDKQAYRVLENLLESMDMAIYKLQQLTYPTIEGKLREMDDGKFELINENEKYITCFSCGSPIECLCYDEFEEKELWFSGRVEHRTSNGQKGYYFCGGDNPFLYTGMKARVRQKD